MSQWFCDVAQKRKCLCDVAQETSTWHKGTDVWATSKKEPLRDDLQKVSLFWGRAVRVGGDAAAAGHRAAEHQTPKKV